jgi:hypothetical protein
MEGQWAKLKSYSNRESTQGESWTSALKLTKLKQKAAHQKNTSLLVRKSYSLFLWMMMKKGVVDDCDDDDEWEPVKPITSPCDSVLEVLRI